MSAKKSPATIDDGGFAGPDRHACQITLDVPRELFDRDIPAFGLLAERLHHDCVEIAAQPALQLSWLQAALIAHGLRSNGSLCLAIARDLLLLPVNDSARFLGFSLANQPLHFQERLTRMAIWPMARQQFKEQYPQGIDIACGRNCAPANLLRARVFRG